MVAPKGIALMGLAWQRILFLVVLLGVMVPGAVVWAQSEDDPFADTEGDTLTTESTGSLSDLVSEAESDDAEENQFGRVQTTGGPFFVKFTNTPKAGIRTNVTSNMYYGDFKTTLNMIKAASFSSTLNYSWSDFRQQIKTAEKRGIMGTYSSGSNLPVIASLRGSKDWSEDITTNSGGFENVSKRDYRTGGLTLSKPKLNWGAFDLTLKSSTGLNEQKAVNQNQQNNFKETYLDGGMQVGSEIVEGVTVAGRLYGRTTGGNRTLGDNDSPSSSTVDTTGIGVYYNRNLATGRVALTRGNFDKKYLDYKRNTSGLIDTVGLDEDAKVVDETEIKDILTLDLLNDMRIWGMTFETKLSHSMNESDFASSRVGYKERLQQDADFDLSFSVGRDSFSIGYAFLWKWDDQLTKDATEKRGRNYKKERDFKAYWGRTLFADTDLRVNYFTGLGQDTSENGYLTTDKDRLRYGLTMDLKRDWVGKFSTNMLFGFKQNHDLALHSTRSSNNNIKDSFEVSPGFSWPVATWLTLTQKYRVYIQYTDYVYSDLAGSKSVDNYNKRATLATVVQIKASERLDLTIKHDYNQRINADKTDESATGSNQYFVYQRQKIGKIDLAFVFKVANGVVLEGATYRTKDSKATINTKESIVDRLEGKIWVGARVNRQWGKDNPLELSAMVRKYNAYGPSVSKTSADYWETDVWLKWSF
jgi:hypothetical protein